MKKITNLLLVSAVAWMGFAPIASAAEFIAPTKTDNGTIVIGSGETHKNLYIAGSNVFVNSQIQGDLYAVAGTVIIDGAVEEDIVLAGGNLVINGKVGGDVRLGGSSVAINSDVGGDVLVGSGDLRIGKDARISGDVLVAGGNVIIEGPVAGSVKLAAGTVIINSEVRGSVRIRAGDSVVFGEKARVISKVNVRAPQTPEIVSGAQVSTPEFVKIERRDHKNTFAKIFTLWLIIKIFAYIIAGLLFLYIIPKRSTYVLRTIKEKFGHNLGVGLIAAVVVPVASIIILFTVVGYYLALIGFIWFTMMLLMSCLFSALFVGSFITHKLMKKSEMVLDWQAVVIGSFVYVAIGIIPVVGWVIQAVLVLAAMGGFIAIAREQIKQGEQ